MRDAMRCNECGGQYIAKHGDLELLDEYIGPFTVEAVEYLECDGCGDLAYSPDTLRKIERAKGQALDEKLQSLPLRDFVSAAEATAMLGISRQALHKHRRIRRGFIFQTQFSEKTVYLKRSVELFRDTGDGRFQLIDLDSQVDLVEKVSGSYVECGSALLDVGFSRDWETNAMTTTYTSPQDEIIISRKPSNVIPFPVPVTTADSEVSLGGSEAKLRGAV
jgi:hypothetical protein